MASTLGPSGPSGPFPNQNPWGQLGSDAHKVTTGGTALTTGINTSRLMRKGEHENLMAQINSEDLFRNRKMTAEQFLRSSSALRRPFWEVEMVMRECMTLLPHERIEDVSRLRIFGVKCWRRIPIVTRTRRSILSQASSGSEAGGSGGESIVSQRSLMGRRATVTPPAQESGPSSSNTNKMTLSGYAEDREKTLLIEEEYALSAGEHYQEIVIPPEDYQITPQNGSTMDVQNPNRGIQDLALDTQNPTLDIQDSTIDAQDPEINLGIPLFTNSLFACASATRGPKNPVSKEVEIYSVPVAPPAWEKYVVSGSGIILFYVVFFPVIEVGSSYIRKMLSRFHAKTADSPGNSIIYQKAPESSPISVPETLYRFNRGEITLNQSKLLLKKVTVLTTAEIDLLLNEKK